jgi:hypothetical protein
LQLLKKSPEKVSIKFLFTEMSVLPGVDGKTIFASVAVGEKTIVGLAPGYKNPGINFAKNTHLPDLNTYVSFMYLPGYIFVKL